MEDMVKPMILAALNDPEVSQQVAKSIDLSAALSEPALLEQLVAAVDLQGQIDLCLSDPSLQQKLLSGIDLGALLADSREQIVASLDLHALLADPALQQHLLANLDIGAILSDPVTQQHLLANLDLGELLAENVDVGAILASPAMQQQLDPAALLGPAKASVAQKLATSDDALNAFHGTLLGGVAFGVTAAALYWCLVTQCALLVVSFGLYVCAFLPTAAYNFIWLHVFQWPETLFAGC